MPARDLIGAATMSHETFDLMKRLRLGGRPAAMATLVRTMGSTPRKEGTKMFVSESGDIFGSVTIGGCVDARVIEEAAEIMSSSLPRLINMELGDEEAREIGLACAGSVGIFLEPIAAESTDPIARIYDQAREEWKRGNNFALATIIGGSGPLPVPIGSRALIGRSAGLRSPFRDELNGILAREVPALIDSAAGSQTISYELEDGSSVDVYLELFRRPSTLLIFGAGAVAVPLVTLSAALGLRTVIIDASPRFASRDRFPDADEIRVGIPSEIAEALEFGPSTPVILVAHDYKIDLPILKKALATGAPYVGMLGSRKRGRTILQMLRDDGISEEQLARVRTPIGLDLGGNSAAEVALSILAEVIAVMHGRSGSSLSATRSTEAGRPR